MSNAAASTPIMVSVALIATDPEDGHDFDVVSEELAADLILRLFGEPRRFESEAGFPGAWLVEFTPDEWEQLQANGFFGLEAPDEGSLEAEMP